MANQCFCAIKSKQSVNPAELNKEVDPVDVSAVNRLVSVPSVVTPTGYHTDAQHSKELQQETNN